MAERGGKRARFLALVGALEAGRGRHPDPAGQPALGVDATRARSGTPGQRWRTGRPPGAPHAEGTTCAGRRRRLERRAVAAGRVLLVSLREPERDVASYLSRCRLAASAASGSRPHRRALAARPASPDASRSSSARGCAPTRRTRGCATSSTCARRAVWSCNGSSARGFCAGSGGAGGRRSARAAGARLRAQRRSHARAARRRRHALDRRLRGAPRPLAAGRVRARAPAGRRSWCWARCPSALRLPRRARGADVRARRKPAVRRRRVAERPLPAQRARVEDRAPPDPGRRPDPAGGVRRRAGRLRSRARAHAGGAGSARLPAGREPPAAAAGDARDRDRRRDEHELEQRVEMCRRAYGEVRLHRPLGDQLAAVPAAPARRSARGSPATTTRSRPSRSRR